MITKINKLKNFGIFSEFEWDKLKEFKKFNLIYGWNGSGKTTISRIFYAIEQKGINFDWYPENGEFEIQYDGKKITKNNISDIDATVKVFNSDFIKDNLFFNEPNKKCKTIVYIGKEDKDKKERIDNLKKSLKTEESENKTLKSTLSDKEKILTEKLKSLGVLLSNKLFDKTYNIKDVRAKISSINKDDIDKYIIKDPEELKKLDSILNEEIKINVSEININSFIKFEFQNEQIDTFEKVFDKFTNLLSKTVNINVLDSLKDDSELSSWTKTGLELHKKRDSKKCLFCDNDLKDKLKIFEEHFNDEYINFLNDLNGFILKIKGLKKNNVSEMPNLYSDILIEYKKSLESLNKSIEFFNNFIDLLIKDLENKKDNLLKEIVSGIIFEDFELAYSSNIKEINLIIKSHNDRTDNFNKEMKDSKSKVELHFISQTISNHDYIKSEKEYKDTLSSSNAKQASIDLNNSELIKLEQENSNTGKAIDVINKYLKEFLGRDEIILELSDDKLAYTIKRNKKTAKNLSEGEKTAIAFSYFISKTEENDFKINDEIIFIDDPISSLDSNFIYNSFSFIKNHFGNSKQLFISTHNFEMFNLIKEWLQSKNRKKEKKEDEHVAEFFMINNIINSSSIRIALISELEDTLKDFKSEYHYLFHLLTEFKNNKSKTYQDYYNIANVARRFIEIYISFKIPMNGDLSSKLDSLLTGTTITKTEKDTLYKTIQEFSHGIDDVNFKQHKNKSEITDSVNTIFKIMEETDNKHLKVLLGK